MNSQELFELAEKVADADGMPHAKMFCVERFIPTECPKCRTLFKEQNIDYITEPSALRLAKKIFHETRGYTIIICTKCNNHTATVPLEYAQFFKKEDAEVLMASEGFVNLQEITCMGTHVREYRMVYSGGPNVYSLNCQEVEEDGNDNS